MKRILAVLILLFLANTTCCNCANANFVTDKKNQIIEAHNKNVAKSEIKKLIKKQTKLVQKYDLNGLSALYSKDFVSSDGFGKDVYFKLIEDTWKSYPDITYTTEIKDIKINGNDAQVSSYETSVATAVERTENATAFGELNSYSNGVYYLKKNNDKWQFTGEKIDDEKTFLKYGDTRFVKMDLETPKNVKAGEYYTASLTIDAPENTFFMASINRDEITYPQEKSEEVFRKVSSDNILERMFLANKSGKNEYNVASVGMTKAEFLPANKVKLYIAGVAFVMTRVNVENAGEKNAK